MLITLYDSRTKTYLGSIPGDMLNSWCDANGYLPHRQASNGWFVIKL